MSSDFYIKRQLNMNEKEVTEGDLLSSLGVAVVLAEPGAGKTCLLESLAKELKVKPVRASIFIKKNNETKSETLVIDALDEVVKIDQSAVDSIIVKAHETGAKKVIFASRSAQWNEAQTRTIKDCFDKDPIIVRLEPLKEEEQRKLFEVYKPEEIFLKFQSAIQEIDLGGLLGNPQFLKIFADAYVKRAGKFTSKSEIFSDAIEQLASEKNKDIDQSKRLPIPKIISLTEKIFTILLLSGATGISAIDRVSEKDFPFINSLADDDKILSVIETGLFKPSQNTNDHEPVHRIIAEYCAARYLVKRIQDSTDRLSMKRCLAIVAPNSVVRDELRGLFAWMAAVGDKKIQERVIKLDPYAIFSNGDPSRLKESSKKMLLENLGELDRENPYFRGADIWRNFSTSGLFTKETVETVRTLLKKSGDNSHLRGLLLDLLKGSSAVPLLADSLRELMLNNKCSQSTRIRAHTNLILLKEYDHIADFNTLLKDKTPDSLMLASQIVINIGNKKLEHKAVLKLFLSISEVYYPKSRGLDRNEMDRYFINKLIQSFEGDDVIFFLDRLSDGLRCTCKKESYDCQCREGKSYLIGKLLDRLFEIYVAQPKAQQIYDWTKSLNFAYGRSYNDSIAVKALQENDELRQAVQRLIFENCIDESEIREARYAISDGYGYAGFVLRRDDFQVIIDYAFNTNNLFLWSNFIAHHQIFSVNKEPNPLRAHMRKQAVQKTEFMRIWAKQQKIWEEQVKVSVMRRTNRMIKHTRKEKIIIKNDQKHYSENIEIIESGNHWGWLRRFTRGYLSQNTEYHPIFVDKKTPERALQNCFPFLKNYIPTLDELSQIRGNNAVVKVLHAACLVQFRSKGHLENIDLNILRAVKTVSHGYNLNDKWNDYEAFNNEINRHIFKTQKDIEQFARKYIEPQLENSKAESTDVGWLQHREEFSVIRKELSIEWLERFSDVNYHSLDTLFDTAANYSDTVKLKELITAKVAQIEEPPEDDGELERYNEKRDFWLLRQLFFIEEICDESCNWLKEGKNRILGIHYIIDTQRGNGWNNLSAEKIDLILNIFVEQWSKVHLPNSWGTSDPPEQTAYRFLKDIIWKIGKDKPSNSIPILENILKDEKFSDFHNEAKNILYTAKRKLALQGYEAPSPNEIIDMLDNLKIASVEDLRVFLTEQIEDLQKDIYGGETNVVSVFYENGNHINEIPATERIVSQLKPQCNALGLTLTIEHQLADAKRCDFTVRGNIDGFERMLVVEIKGQWNKELYTAAAEQLHERYSIHPNAEGQGVFLVLWFGKDEKVAGCKNPGIATPEQLKDKIIAKMPPELHSLIDVVILDFS